MENPEEILHSLEEFSKMKPKDIPRELEEYLCYVAKTGNPVYQWNSIKSLFREKLLSVITDFYESCPAVDIPPCPNVEVFNYELMKNFILEKLDTFSSAPFTVQRICELLTTPRKEYNRIDKYMRALEKNILVVSTTEPGRRSTENGESIMNGLESEHPEHLAESSDSNHDINVEEMDDSPSRPRTTRVFNLLIDSSENESQAKVEEEQISVIQENFENESEEKTDVPSSSNVTEPPEHIHQETVITCQVDEESEQSYIPAESVVLDTCTDQPQETVDEPQLETNESSPVVSSNPDTNIDGDEVKEEEEEKDTEMKIEPKEEDTKEADALQSDVVTEDVVTKVTCSESSKSTEEPQSEKSKVDSDLLEETAITESITSQSTDSPDAEHHSSEAEHDSSEAEHDSSEAEHDSSEAEHESSEAEHIGDSSEIGKNEAETTKSTEEETLEETKPNVDESKKEESTEIVSSDCKEDQNGVQDMVVECSEKVSNVEVENIADSSTSFEEMTDTQDKSPDISPESKETPSEAEKVETPIDPSEEETTNEALVSKTSETENIPMDIDVISETETEKKVVTDEPSSTSTDISA